MSIEIWIDGSSRPKLLKKKKSKVGPSASSFIVKKDNKIIHKESKYVGLLDNNQAEYEALLMALQYIINSNIEIVTIFTDSNLVECQMNGKYNSYADSINGYYEKGKELLSNIHSYQIIRIPRGGNKEADKMCKVLIDKMIERGETSWEK